MTNSSELVRLPNLPIALDIEGRDAARTIRGEGVPIAALLCKGPINELPTPSDFELELYSPMRHPPALQITAFTFGMALQSRPPSSVLSPNGESLETQPPQLSRSCCISTHS